MSAEADGVRAGRARSAGAGVMRGEETDPPAPEASPAGASREPIFVVGSPRSGTTLMAALLGAHSGIAAGPETHLFRSMRRPRAIERDPAWPNRAFQLLSHLEQPGVGRVLDHYDLDPASVRADLAGRPHSLRSLMEVICEPHARAAGKRRWLEKTPGHLLEVRRIRSLWPNAPIIRVIRDPRAVVASHVRMPFGPTTAAGAAYQWEIDNGLSDEFFELDARGATVRYEDLLTDPEPVMRRLCAFVGEVFEAEMLVSGDRSTVAPGEWWKDRIGSGVDRSRALAWQVELSADDRRMVELICTQSMRRHGYTGEGQPRLIVEFHPYVRAILAAEASLGQLADLGVIGLPAGSPAIPAKGRLIIFGARGEHRWRRGGTHGVPRLARRLLADRLHRRPALWFDAALGKEQANSLTDRAGDGLLRLLAVRVTAESVAGRLTEVAARPR